MSVVIRRYTLTALSPHLDDPIPLVVGAFQEENIRKVEADLKKVGYRQIIVKIE